jgi:hypothetical protein
LRRKASNSQRSTPGHKTTLHKSQRILAIGYDAKVDATMGLMPQHGPGDGLGAMNDITPATMTRRQKAAVIVRLLLAHGVSPGVDKLSPSHQSVLARAMSGLGQIDRATLGDIVRSSPGRSTTSRSSCRAACMTRSKSSIRISPPWRATG